jgi:hypothetical protein
MKGLSFVSERGLPPPLRRDAGVFLMVRHYSDRREPHQAALDDCSHSCIWTVAVEALRNAVG